LEKDKEMRARAEEEIRNEVSHVEFIDIEKFKKEWFEIGCLKKDREHEAMKNRLYFEGDNLILFQSRDVPADKCINRAPSTFKSQSSKDFSSSSQNSR